MEWGLGIETRNRWILRWVVILGVASRSDLLLSLQSPSAHFLSPTLHSLCHCHSTETAFAKVPTKKVEFSN